MKVLTEEQNISLNKNENDACWIAGALLDNISELPTELLQKIARRLYLPWENTPTINLIFSQKEIPINQVFYDIGSLLRDIRRSTFYYEENE